MDLLLKIGLIIPENPFNFLVRYNVIEIIGITLLIITAVIYHYKIKKERGNLWKKRYF